MSITAIPLTTIRTLLSLGLLLCATVATIAQEPPPPVTQSPSGRVEPTTPPPAAITGESKYSIDKRLGMFQKIRDDDIFPWADIGARRLEDAAVDKLEERAYDEVLRHARQFTTAELEEHARRDVMPRDLYTNGRVNYTLDLLYFEGWLRRLRKVPAPDRLKESGVTDVYEAWIFPDGGDSPLCVFITELPPGLDPQTNLKESINRYVSVAGYYFKLLRYESGEVSKDRNDLGRHITRRAPVIMARSLTLRDDSTVNGGAIWRETAIPLVVGGVAFVAFTLLGLSVYFRRTDAIVRREIEKKLTNNPFANG